MSVQSNQSDQEIDSNSTFVGKGLTTKKQQNNNKLDEDQRDSSGLHNLQEPNCSNNAQPNNFAHALPWSWRKEKSSGFITSNGLDKTVQPGEFVLRALFAEFAVHVEKKTDAVLSSELVEKPLSKLLQKGEDPAFDQLITGNYY